MKENVTSPLWWGVIAYTFGNSKHYGHFQCSPLGKSGKLKRNKQARHGPACYGNTLQLDSWDNLTTWQTVLGKYENFFIDKQTYHRTHGNRFLTEMCFSAKCAHYYGLIISRFWEKSKMFIYKSFWTKLGQI